MKSSAPAFFIWLSYHIQTWVHRLAQCTCEIYVFALSFCNNLTQAPKTFSGLRDQRKERTELILFTALQILS